MSIKTKTTNSFLETKKLGEALAEQVFKKGPKKKAFVFGLIGGLGSGKTTFLQGFARGLGIREKILSPTFVILKKFKIQNSKFKILYHIDCYRIERPKEILDLRFKEIIKNPQNIIVIEWADRIWKTLPKNTLIMKFVFVDEKTRKIKIKKRRTISQSCMNCELMIK